MDPTAHRPEPSPWKNFAISLVLVILLFVSALFTGIYINSYRAIEAELLSRARAIFNSIVLTREWAASHGAVYVEKTAAMQSNPYLRNPDMAGADGTIYTKKNPALITREISEIAADKGLFRFRITSLKPLNPANEPDPFERRSLLLFEKGKAREAVAKVFEEDSCFFRYTAPLYADQSCLACHPGYKVGDVRGAISVIFNVDSSESAVKTNRVLIVSLFITTLVIFVGIVSRLVLGLKRKLEAAEAKIRRLAVTDELTGLKNRRFIMERLEEEFLRSRRYQRSLCCILFDIDFFKRVNDTHGHDGGDEVLRQVSHAAYGLCRETDSLGRYGGEEFLLLTPESDPESGRFAAERYRTAIENLPILLRDGQTVRVTASFGVACADFSARPPEEGPATADDLFKQADTALFLAKGKGRNRVEAHEGGADTPPSCRCPVTGPAQGC